MSTPSPTRPDAVAPGKGRPSEQLKAAITASVLRTLGEPADLLRVVVVRLWDNRYRVNVETGTGATCCRVAHSYFLDADDNGEVIGSDPAITRSY